MDKEKHIEEIHLTESEILANDIAQICPDLVNSGCGDLSCVTCLTKGLEQIGYRKASDVAREIFEEIEKLIEPNGNYLWQWDLNRFAELKKKYEKE